ncbi:MAG: hypothetical protein Q7T74_02595 [Candidatus Saccharibacteria bacterium]|nr:hypothetical protein [Candidatus Saccharibacteria bacterium]
MSEKTNSTSPEAIDSSIIDDIVETATGAVDKYGDGQTPDTIGGKPKSKSGYFLIRHHGIEGLDPNKVPSLSISVPVGEFIDDAAWKVGLTFGYQDGGLSNQVLIRKDNTIAVSYYDGRPDEYLTSEGATEFSVRLSEIVQEVGEDYIDPFKDLPVIDQPHE